jgi:bifunctional UDP-N-acetylglucosamine pyrophosphorylase/glucosamine-1-phosphate N-acetyltransferase/UDP-N-acetylglucosamine pyrophosphorylase
MQQIDSMKKIAVIILAAGLGTRMKSDKAKVLHEILGRPMILYVVETAVKVAGNQIVVVIGNQAETVREAVSAKYQVCFALQEKQLGTGHAVMCALPEVPESAEDVLILCGDVPLIRSDTLLRLLENHLKNRHDISLLAVNTDNPAGYGRILMNKNMQLAGIVEERDATAEQKNIKTVNTGIYCVKKHFLKQALQKIRPNNVQKEFYLTDIIGIAYREGKNLGILIGDRSDEVTGINTPEELKNVETVMRSEKIS